MSLAAALVRVARMGVPRPLEPLVTSLIADGRNFPPASIASSTRIRRAEFPRVWNAGSLLFPALLLLVALQPAAILQSVHHLIERLVALKALREVIQQHSLADSLHGRHTVRPEHGVRVLVPERHPQFLPHRHARPGSNPGWAFARPFP